MPISQQIPRYTTSCDTEIERFRRDGFIIVRGQADAGLCRRMQEFIIKSLHPATGPLEYEVDVEYPGSPVSRLAPGGETPRRLLNAYSRDEMFRNWATSAPLISTLSRLLANERITLSQSHHNCIMTKHPGFSSETHWHQNIRYWSFDRPDLITVWLALGDEHPENGGLSLIPGSHCSNFDRGRFDAALFLREDLPENRALIDGA
ncbi:MAG: phytanoyl-CoA dioxygenase family protein, partial [Gammaproteobacteria bacterium]|nr:phytanoyl-CoA dioxygenase family protein [Gammaproteobacteria bacterium]